jgi:hypothetical protein
LHINQLLEYPYEFVTDQFYRFEGKTDPSDEAIVYAISSVGRDIRGLLVNGYGISAEEFVNEIVSKIHVRDH